MAYVTYYNILFDAHLNERTNILIQRKDGDPGFVVQDIKAREFKMNCEADGDGLYSSIIRKNIELQVNLLPTDSVDWNTFFDQVHDEWRVVATNDTQGIFQGFMQPDEGIVPFEDKPYDLTIRATDCIALLKNVPLKKIDGTDFKGKFTLIQYISACLFYTGQLLKIKIYCDLFESSMNDRGTDPKWDMFAQAKLDHRTFKKDAVEFVSCFEALEIIFKEHFRIFQDYDKVTDQLVWCIYRIPQYQYTPAPIVYYTIYDYDGTNPVGYEDPENYATVGKLELQYKTNQVDRSGKFAVKKTRHSFMYKVWPEIPINNKFEHGTLIAPLSGPLYTAYTIDDWNYGTFLEDSGHANALPGVTATAQRAYRKSTYDIYGIEKEREIILEEPTSGGYGLLISSPTPVNAGDKIKISFDRKLSYAKTTNGVSRIAMIFIKPDDGSAKRYIETQNTVSNGKEFHTWKFASFGQSIFKYYDTSESFQEYVSFSITPPIVPINGQLYIGFITTGRAGSLTYFKNIHLEYQPAIAGGYLPVKGDYWERSQNLNFVDVTDNEVSISDSIPRAVKGSLCRIDGFISTTPTWYRYGLVENRHYKELLNIGRYNSEYRRFMKFAGTFTGTKFSPNNDPTSLQPISFRKTYRFVDVTELPECVLVCPLSIDYKTGWVTANFEEVRRPSLTVIPETLTDFINRVIVEINSTPADGTGWNSASGAPAPGTIAYPPIAAIYPLQPRSMSISINELGNMTANVSIGGGGNSPSITDTYNNDVGTYRAIVFQFGTDIAVGNVFQFSAYGHNVNVTVQATINASNDGRQMGDSSNFNYLFE